MPDRLAEIRARLDAATPGTSPRWAEIYRAEHWFDGLLPRPHAKFYGHSPADIAWLLDEVERLRKEVAYIAVFGEATDA